MTSGSGPTAGSGGRRAARILSSASRARGQSAISAWTASSESASTSSGPGSYGTGHTWPGWVAVGCSTTRSAIAPAASSSATLACRFAIRSAHTVCSALASVSASRARSSQAAWATRRRCSSRSGSTNGSRGRSFIAYCSRARSSSSLRSFMVGLLRGHDVPGCAVRLHCLCEVVLRVTAEALARAVEPRVGRDEHSGGEVGLPILALGLATVADRHLALDVRLNLGDPQLVGPRKEQVRDDHVAVDDLAQVVLDLDDRERGQVHIVEAGLAVWARHGRT